MPWLALNGVNVGAVASIGEPPKGEGRDIGEMGEAVDGSKRVTRQTRKRDLDFSTVPLTSSLAFAWESLIIGEGETWNFDTSPYGSKGTGPHLASSVYSTGAFGKYGAGGLRLPATTGLFEVRGTLLNLAGSLVSWTVLVWRQETPYHHYIVRSDGSKWLDGVSSGVSTTWLTAPFGDGIKLTNTGGAAVDYDDLVVLPFAIPDAWALQLYTAHNAGPFSALPFLNATGNLVNEQATRRMLGSCSETVLVAAPKGEVRQADMKRLQVKLQAA